MRKRDLTREKICEAAIKLIEAEGLHGLSMRRLAEELSVEAASLYNHMANKSALLDMIQEHVYAQLSLDVSLTDWKDHLFEIAVKSRAGLLQFPDLAVLFATRPTVTASSLAQAERTLEILNNAGFKPSQLLTIFRNIHVFVLGHVLAEVGQVPGDKNNYLEPSLDHIDLNQYPRLKKTYAYKSSLDFESGFRLGLTNMLNGLEVLLKQTRA